MLERETDFHRRHKVPCMAKFQFHIIGRADDVSHIETADLREHEIFSDFCLQTKVSWSKNVLEERDCPEQILIGANDTDFCVLLALACYLETRFSSECEAGSDDARFLFGEYEDEDEPIRTNERYRNTLKKVWLEPEFQQLLALIRGATGSHSLRKFASTWPAEHGVSQQDIEIRGRWKGKKNGRTVNLYISVEQLPTDGRVAAILCVGGPIKYKLKTNSHVTDAFLKDVVCPGIFKHFENDANNKIGSVLALPLLWAAHQPGLEHLMSNVVRQRIKEGYNVIRGDNDPDWNPVVKVPLVITRVENQLVIDKLLPGPDGPGDGGAPLLAAANLQGHREQLQSVLNQVHHLRQELVDTRQHLDESYTQLWTRVSNRLTVMCNNINRLRGAAPFAVAVAPAEANTAPQIVIPAGQAGAAQPPRVAPPATLSPSPASIHDLWAEWTHGIGGRKPASQFTTRDKQAAGRSTFSRRNNVWQIIKRLVDAGIDADVACDRIYQAYGHNKGVSAIIQCVYDDRRLGRGVHPNLRV
jgi:Transcriptional activator of glycolytic enzymes